MTVVVSLERFTPLVRSDGIPWTKALIYESLTNGGASTLIDTITLTPVDADPANPVTRDLTTVKATVTEGWYCVAWGDAFTNLSSPTPWLQNTSDLAVGVRPSVTDVASLLRARTKVKGGAEAGTFNTMTRPTIDEVEDLIDDALETVMGAVQPIDQTLVPGSAFNAPGSKYEQRIKGAVKLYAAVLVELSYHPEQVRTGQSAAPTYQALYDSKMRALVAEGETGNPQGLGGGGAGGGSGDAPADAAWAGFPDYGPGGAIGLSSRWLYEPALFEPWERLR